MRINELSISHLSQACICLSVLMPVLWGWLPWLLQTGWQRSAVILFEKVLKKFKRSWSRLLNLAGSKSVLVLKGTGIEKFHCICLISFFIECISGLYGNECNFNCSQFCHDQVCYGATGECVNGCQDGYIGGLCKTRNIQDVIMFIKIF